MMSMIKLDISSLGRSNEVLFDYSVQYYHNYSNTLPYNDRIKLMALHRQALSGEYCISKDNAVPGFFDFVGKDIVSAWKDLKRLSTQNAKCEFVELLNDKSDRFGLWLSDIFASKIINDKLLQNTIQQTADSSNNYNSNDNNNNNINNNSSSNNNSNNNISLPPHITIGNSQIHKNLDHSNILEKPQKLEMISAEHDDTNNQHEVVIQSKSNAVSNKNISSNDNAIKYDNNNTTATAATTTTTNNNNNTSTTTIINSNNSNNKSIIINNNNNNNNNNSNKQTHSDQESIIDVQTNPGTTTSTQIKPAVLWCKMNEAKEFIKETSSDPESIVTISAGETLTIKVPVMPDIDMFFWEFALEKYDIGFGVYMELSDTTTTNATTISSNSSSNISSNSNSSESIDSNDVIELIPLERRICTEDVIVGCHSAITERERAGVRMYHLKFENRYSFFRKKFLHYKIYCRRS